MPARNASSPLTQSAPSSRRPGRPRGGAINPEQREHLIDLTLQLYGRDGVAQTSLNAIARAAGVSPAMINYYFQSRDALLDVVIAERFMPLRHQISDAFLAQGDDPVAAIRQMMTTLYNAAVTAPWLASLWMQEVISGEGAIRTRMAAHYGNAHQAQVLDVLKRWQSTGVLNPALDVTLLLSSMVALILVPLCRLQQTQPQTDPDGILQHALNLVLHGIGDGKPAD